MQYSKLAGTLRRPSFAELFQPKYRKTTIVTALMFACSYGAAFGAVQHLPRIVPGLAEVARLPRISQQQLVSGVQFMQEMGGLVGRILLAFLAGILRVPTSVMQLAGDIPAQGPPWYVVLQAVVGLTQFLIALLMVAGYRKGGIWGSR